MKLRALDQMHVSAVKPDSLRPGEEFEVSDALGTELLKKHPKKFRQIGGEKSEKPASNKALGGAPKNK